jgi:hypothetical protein
MQCVANVIPKADAFDVFGAVGFAGRAQGFGAAAPGKSRRSRQRFARVLKARD